MNELLMTQKYGRQLAADLLKRIPQWCDEGSGDDGALAPFAILERDPEDGEQWREGEQCQRIKQFFDSLYAMPEPVRVGFFAVFSDWLAQELSDGGAPDYSYYQRLDSKGLIQDVDQ